MLVLGKLSFLIGRCPMQRDLIGRFIALWATFLSLWQQLFCPICHILGDLLKVSKSFIFLVQSVLGHFLQTFCSFLLVTLVGTNDRFPCKGTNYSLQRLTQLPFKRKMDREQSGVIGKLSLNRINKEDIPTLKRQFLHYSGTKIFVRHISKGYFSFQIWNWMSQHEAKIIR